MANPVIVVAAPAQPATVRWQPERAAATASWPRPPMATALLNGLKGNCPACGKGRIFKSFLRVVDACPECSAPLGAVRADDVPPYFTILIVGHLIVPAMLWLERAQTPPLWVHTAIWVPLTILLSLALIQPVKGAVVGLMLTLGMVKTDSDA